MEVAPPVNRRGYYDKKGGGWFEYVSSKRTKSVPIPKSVYPAIIVSIKFSSIA